MRNMAPIAFVAWIAAFPASATVYRFEWTGAVTTIQRFGAALDDVRVGDTAAASFVFDDSTAVILSSAYYPTTLIYDVVLTNYSWSTGSLGWSAPSVRATLYLQDDSFSQDGFTFLTYTDNYAPRASVQHNAFGPVTASGTPSLANGFPVERLPDQRLFLGVGAGGSDQENIWSTMTTRVTVLSSAPEPASWAMLITGFDMIGAAMRRRSLRLAAA